MDQFDLPSPRLKSRRPEIRFADEPQSFIGLILSVEQHNESSLSRATIIIDAVDARLDQNLVEKPASDWDRRHLAILRIMTTADNFAKLAKLKGTDDAEGEEDLAGRWVHLALVPLGKVTGPRAQVCRLGAVGYDDMEIFTVAEITDFGSDPVEPKSLGAAANANAVFAGKLKKRRLLRGTKIETTATRHDVLRLLRSVMQAKLTKVIVHDVGHASFTTVMDTSGRPLLHFDAGWPIPFNWRTYPPHEPAPPFAEIVVLSHWDWDHLHGYHRWANIKSAFWIVPDQLLGPNAELVVEELKAANRLIRIPPNPNKIYSFGPITLSQADPSTVSGKSKKRNNSGLVLNVVLENRKSVLVPGDADYIAIPQAVSMKPSLMIIPHHGADVDGPIPSPHGKQPLAVVSMGTDNCYQHPSISGINAHYTAGWKIVRFTSISPLTAGRTSVARGDKALK